MSRSQVAGILLAMFTALSSVGSAHANLLTNGSFESGSFVNQGNDTMSLPAGSDAITDWTVVADVTAWIGPANPFGLSASAGSYFLDLTNYQAGSPFAGVQQPFASVAGATYELSFDLGASSFYGRPNSIVASAADASSTFVSPSSGTNNDWYRHSLQFVATSATTTVLLQGASGANYIGLDNVAVELVSAPIPEPKSWALLGLGLVAVCALTRRRSA